MQNYQEENSLLTSIDSLHTAQLQEYKNLSDAYSIKIDTLSKEISKKDKTIMAWKIGSMTITAGLVIWLLLK